MSKFDALLGKSKTYTIGGIEIELKPRNLEDIGLFLDMNEPEKRAKALGDLIRVSLVEAGATEGEVKQIAFKYFKEISEAILDVNGLSVPQ